MITETRAAASLADFQGRSPWEPDTVGNVLHRAASERGSRTALIYEGTELTNADLLIESQRRLAQLAAAGIKRGDAVLLMLQNRPEFVTTWLATSLGGIVEVPVNTDFKGETLRYVLEDSGAESIVIEPEFIERLTDVADGSQPLRQVLVLGKPPAKANVRGAVVRSLDELEPGPDVSCEVADHDPIGILYTSGTTGPAKGTLITHRHAYEYALACVEMLELRERDVYYAPLPLFHIAGQWAVVYAGLISGAAVVLKRRFSVEDFWRDCRQHGVTASFLLGAMAQFLHGQPADRSDADNDLDRVLMVPLIEALDEFRTRFGVRVTTCYGSTETGVPIVAGYDVDEPTVAGTGRAGYELRLVDEDDREVAPGEVGELCVRHRNPWVTMVEYRGKPAETLRAFRNLWLHSGDAMRLDQRGRYHFVDRIHDALRRRGENISSFEVEREVYAHPNVLECAAIGVPSQYTEDDLVVVAAPRPGASLTDQELHEFLRERAPRFMVPDRVVVVDAMPKTPTGKIRKHELRERLGTRDTTGSQTRRDDADTAQT